MQLYKARLGWTEGMNTLIFHGQRADVADIFNLTSVFQVASLYQDTRFAEAKLLIGYILGTFWRLLAGYSEGLYLLTEKGGQRQLAELLARGLTPKDVWVLEIGDPRRRGS